MGRKRFIALFIAAVMLVAMLPAASVRPAKAEEYIAHYTFNVCWQFEYVKASEAAGRLAGYYFPVEYDEDNKEFYTVEGNRIYVDKEARYIPFEDTYSIEVYVKDFDDPLLTGLEISPKDVSYYNIEVVEWATSAGGAPVYTSKEPYFHVDPSCIQNGMTLYPVTWKRVPYITYHNTYNDEIYESGGGYSEGALDEVFGCPYHYLLGWSETKGGELKYHPGDEIPGESKQKTEHMDLYSVWGQSRISDIPPVMVRDKNEIEQYWFGGIRWRKIGASEDKVLLIYDQEMTVGKEYENNYPFLLYPRILRYCDELYDGLSDADRAAVCSTSKEKDSPETAALEENKVFLISWLEAKTYFADNEDRKFYTSGIERWYLRFSFNQHISENDGFPHVNADGKYAIMERNVNPWYYLEYYGLNYFIGARPAFVLDLNAVLFTSAEVEVKNAAPTDESSFGSAKYSYENDGMRKITLQDEIYKDFKATINSSNNNQGRIGVTPGETLSVSYENALTDTEDIKNRYISAMLCNRYGEVIGYASMKPTASSGTWELKLPQNLNIAKEEYTLKIFNEQRNGYGCSDFGSPFSVFTLGKPKEATPDATFTATGADSGILSGLTPGASYQVNGSYVDDGLSPKDVADSNGNIEFASGLSEGDRKSVV